MSVRVPWHDSGWGGSVCHDPQSDSSCILLKNIGQKRDDLFETANAGGALAALDPKRMPCIAERSTFMSSRDHKLELKHPYVFHDSLKNIAPATVPVPAWSVHATPYYWLNKDCVGEVLEQHRIDNYSEDAEQSLVFFYLKHSPFEDTIDARRVEAALTAITASAQADGHILLPPPTELERLDALVLAQPMGVTTTVLEGLDRLPDTLNADPQYTWPPLASTTLGDGSHAYKLHSAIERVNSINTVLGPLRT